MLLDFRDGTVRLLDLGCLLVAFVFSVSDVAPRAFYQFSQFLRALTVELDAVPVRSNLAVQSLNFCTGFGDLGVDLVQRTAFLGERVFAVVDFRARGLLAVRQTLDFFPRRGQVALERSELFASMMCLKHAQICV